MNDNDLMDAMAAAVKQAIDEATAPLRADIAILKADLASRPNAEAHAAIVARAAIEAAAAAKPADGKSLTIEDVRPMLSQMVAAIPPAPAGKNVEPAEIAAEVARQIALVPPPKDGESVDLGAIFSEIGKAVTRAVEALPPPVPGKSVTLDEVRPLIAEAVKAIPAPKDGAPADPVDYEVIGNQVALLVNAKFLEIPKPKDGTSVTLDDVRPLIDHAVAALPKPKDGTSVEPEQVRQLILGELGPEVVKIYDAVKTIPVPKDGESVHPDTVRLMVTEAVEAAVAKAISSLPEPMAGKDADPIAIAATVHDEIARQFDAMRPYIKGEPGDNGLGLDDLSVDLKEDGRTLVLTFSRGDREKTFELECPWMIYRGVYVKGSVYKTGDTVTYGGSTWVARRQTELAPGTDDWQLSVKRGQDAK